VRIHSPARARALIITLTMAVLCVSCDSRDRSSDGLLVGTVTYRERSALPLNAIVELRLEDLAQADAAPQILATRVLATEGRQVPIPFEMRYPGRLVDARRHYGVRAEIRAANGRLLFATAKPEPVFRDGPATEVVRLVLLQAASVGMSSRTTVPDGVWHLVSMRREDESVQSMAEEPAYTIEFAADGSVSGWSHCFRFAGRYSEGASGQLSITKLVAPTVRCPAPSRADEFVVALDRVTHHEIRAAQWMLMYGVGGELTFNRH
jgi:putative lipoprotein